MKKTIYLILSFAFTLITLSGFAFAEENSLNILLKFGQHTQWGTHTGVHFIDKNKKIVRAPASGIVEEIKQPTGFCAKKKGAIVIRHEMNDLYSFLCLFVPEVSVGATVSKGEVIGKAYKANYTKNQYAVHYELRTANSKDDKYLLDPTDLIVSHCSDTNKKYSVNMTVIFSPFCEPSTE